MIESDSSDSSEVYLNSIFLLIFTGEIELGSYDVSDSRETMFDGLSNILIDLLTLKEESLLKNSGNLVVEVFRI